MGLCPGLQGGIRTTLTHTVLLLSLLFYPSRDPSFPLFFSSPFFSRHLFSHTVRFSACVTFSLLVDLCGSAVVSGGTVIKQVKGSV